jgi:copper transport protein
LISTDVWAAAIDGSFARSIALATVSLLLSLAAIVQPGRGRSLSVLSILMIGPAFAFTGHASESGTTWLSVAALSVHVVAVCFWAGALPRLWMILRPGQRGQSVALRRFSTAIPYAVAAIVLPGAYLAAIEIGIPEALWRTSYGNVLSTKLALVACALLLGAFNRLFLTKSVAVGSVASARLMKRIVCAEVVLIALVLCVTGAIQVHTASARAVGPGTDIHLRASP